MSREPELPMEPFLELSLELRSIADFTGRIHWINEAYQEALGYTLEEINEVSWKRMAHPADLPAVMVEVAKMAVGKLGRVDVRLRCKDGAYKWFRISARVAKGEGHPLNRLFYTSGVEITDERELRAAKDRFIANAAHELRAPIAAINGSISTLLESGELLSDDERALLLGMLQRQGARLALLADNLLSHSRSELVSGRASVRPVEVSEVVASAVDHVHTPAGTRIDDTIGADVCVLADPSRLDQILVNLLSNALAYGASHVQVHTREAGPLVEIVVSDDGPGVPVEFVPDLFEPFTRAAASPGGSGLGLAISRRLARAMDGDLAYEPSPSGATFVVRLPVASGQRHETAAGDVRWDDRPSGPT